MSFILDALRKSEHERQRQTGPALVEVAVAAPKPKPNRWATAAIALLVVNLVAIGVLLLMKSGDDPVAESTDAAPVAAPATAPSATASIAAPATSPPAAQASMTQALPEPQVSTPPPMLRPAVPPPASGTRNSLEDEMSSGVPPMDPEAAVAAAAPPAGRAVAPARGGSVVYQSLQEAEPSATYGPPQASTSDLPRADDMTARGALPELRLELHVWSTKPQERFVFVNGRRYREGDATAEGAKVEEITRDGVIMNAGGNRFLLSRD